VFGRFEREMGPVLYAEGWRQVVELNAPFELLEKAKKGSYENPLVTVALRSDGSVEKVVFNRSSGQPDIDNAVRRIIQLLAPYQPFPAELEAEYDIIEIPRIWSFDKALRLIWEGR